MTIIKYYFHGRITVESSGSTATNLAAQRNSSYILTNLLMLHKQQTMHFMKKRIEVWLMTQICLYKLHIWLAPSRDSVRFGDKSLRENRFAPPLHATTEEISFVIVTGLLLFVEGFMNSRKSTLEWRRRILSQKTCFVCYSLCFVFEIGTVWEQVQIIKLYQTQTRLQA